MRRSDGYSSTVLELKDGRFRYWFSSDVKTGHEPQYPLSGEYSVSGDTITLHNAQVSQNAWTFRTVECVLTLWRPDAIDYYNQEKGFHSYGILWSTDEPAEEAWAHRGYSKPYEGFVPDTETAIKIATAVMEPIWGKKNVAAHGPYHAELIDGVWIVTGSVPKAGFTLKARISKDNGRVLLAVPSRK